MIYYSEQTPAAEDYRPRFGRITAPSKTLLNLRSTLAPPKTQIDNSKDTACYLKTMNDIQKESDLIETVKKKRVFDDEISVDEMGIISQRVALQQRQFEEYEAREKARKFLTIKAIWEWVSKDEVEEAYREANQDEEQVTLSFTDPRYIVKIRKKIAKRFPPNEVIQQENMSIEQQQAYEKMIDKRKTMLKKNATGDFKLKSRKYKKMKLDDALSQLENGADPEQMFEGWSAARITAYKLIETNPNSYYYRFNAPGEKQRNGTWTESEKIAFNNRVKEMGADGQWGIFSMAINGRVGYQCSNYYRLLIKSGQIIDPNYFIDEKGKIHYLFGKKDGNKGVIRVHSKHGSAESNSKSKRRRKSTTNTNNADDEDVEMSLDGAGDTDGTFVVDETSHHRSTSKLQNSRKSFSQVEEVDMNPLPGFIDPITLDEIVKPAISKYGHVMGYDNWIRCLSSEDRKNVCPLTKKPLNKREVVVLTHDNIEEYRDMIVNI